MCWSHHWPGWSKSHTNQRKGLYANTSDHLFLEFFSLRRRRGAHSVKNRQTRTILWPDPVGQLVHQGVWHIFLGRRYHDGGRMVIPIGAQGETQLFPLVRKEVGGQVTEEVTFRVASVPLV